MTRLYVILLRLVRFILGTRDAQHVHVRPDPTGPRPVLPVIHKDLIRVEPIPGSPGQYRVLP
ncbi:MAG TPA: hypothetical protein DCQ64_16015 [Candidatus Rokubacteria bacterium]|nr:hypothetical protein [Candidatus Rokubacteria bacterium]